MMYKIYNFVTLSTDYLWMWNNSSSYHVTINLVWSTTAKYNSGDNIVQKT